MVGGECCACPARLLLYSTVLTWCGRGELSVACNKIAETVNGDNGRHEAMLRATGVRRAPWHTAVQCRRMAASSGNAGPWLTGKVKDVKATAFGVVCGAPHLLHTICATCPDLSSLPHS